MQISLSPVSIVGAFLAGILASFTPCVYPFIPVTLSFIGVKANTSKIKGFLLSLTFSCGLALTFSVLGVIAALSGKVFGSFTQTPFFYLLIANIYLLLALNLLDILKVPVKYFSFLSILASKKIVPKGFLSVFILGALSGLVISPCTTPILGAILTYIAKERDILMGSMLLTSFALGMSVLLILAGTFGAFLQSLPKSGVWNRRLKNAAAIILIIASEYFFMKAGSLL
jgi:thiol:disulfide interchange protein DsbD